jgi:hypothetical protein
MHPYVYEPLDVSQPSFRLVRLIQGEESEIKCDLFHAAIYDAEDAIEYEALSYTWGSNDKPHYIEVNGRTLDVTKSLLEALQHLRQKNEDRILWIDAICIDQNDHKERGHQVQQMPAIYENARQVVIWLGLATPETDLVFSYMQQLERQSFNYTCKDWAPADDRWKFLWSSVTLAMKRMDGGNMSQQSAVLIFIALLARPWFQRVWVLQEVAKARRAKVMCGNKTVSSHIFAVMSTLLEARPESHEQAVLDIMPGSSRKYSWWVEKRDLCTLVSKFCKAKASDPRDMIYALLGISSDAYDTDALRPDYSKSLEDVIKTTVTFFLDRNTENGHKEESPALWQYPAKDSFPQDSKVFLEASSCEQQLVGALRGQNVDYQGPMWSFKHENFYEQTVLACAVQDNHARTVNRLIRSPQINVNTQDWLGRTPLHLAVENGSEGTVRALLDHEDIGPHMLDWWGRTPLSWAAGQGRVNIVKVLLDTGKFNLKAVDKSGWTPLSLAEANGHDEVVRLLEEYAT